MTINTDIIPVRWPSSYLAGKLEYANLVNGELGRFSGTETISLDGVEVYKCWYHGGTII